MKRIFALLLSSLAACSVLAQTVATSIALSWVAPTTNTDGTTITGTLTYALYQGTKGGTFTQVGTGLTGTNTTVTSASAGNCFELIAVETLAGSTTASAPAGPVCAEVPGSPSGFTVTWTVTVH